MTIDQTARADAKEATLHRRILQDIEGKIVSGEWPVGHRIPFEVDLAKAYGVSRMTVNKVLTQLARAGLIDRVKRSGSFVSQPHTQSAVLEISDIRKEVESLKLPYAFKVTRHRQRKAGVADLAMLDVEPGTPILDLVCTHMAGDHPFCLEQRLISLASVPEAENADFSEVTPGAWLIQRVPWSSAQHRIHAAAADEVTGPALGIAVGTPCLVVERRTWSAAGPVTYVCFTYPGNRHALVANFAPAS